MDCHKHDIYICLIDCCDNTRPLTLYCSRDNLLELLYYGAVESGVILTLLVMEIFAAEMRSAEKLLMKLQESGRFLQLASQACADCVGYTTEPLVAWDGTVVGHVRS